MPVRRSERLLHLRSTAKKPAHRKRRPPPRRRSVAPDTGSSTSIPTGNFRSEKGAAAMSSGRDSHRHDAAQWEGHPQRCTFFLEVLAEEKSEGRMPQGCLTNMLYRKLADRFFDKFQVWHDKGQFRNHYNSRRDQWRLVKELQIATGISWDHDRKMVITDPEWWDKNKGRKGISGLRGRPVADWELLDYVFNGQYAEGALLHNPQVPRWPPQSGIGDCSMGDAASGSQENPSPAAPKGSSRPSNSQKGKRKQYNTAPKNAQPRWDSLEKAIDMLLEKKEQQKMRRSAETQRTEDSVKMNKKMTASEEMNMVTSILIEEMCMDVGSDLFVDAVNLMETSRAARSVLLKLPLESRGVWLEKQLTRGRNNASFGDH